MPVSTSSTNTCVHHPPILPTLTPTLPTLLFIVHRSCHCSHPLIPQTIASYSTLAPAGPIDACTRRSHRRLHLPVPQTLAPTDPVNAHTCRSRKRSHRTQRLCPPVPLTLAPTDPVNTRTHRSCKKQSHCTQRSRTPIPLTLAPADLTNDRIVLNTCTHW